MDHSSTVPWQVIKPLIMLMKIMWYGQKLQNKWICLSIFSLLLKIQQQQFRWRYFPSWILTHISCPVYKHTFTRLIWQIMLWQSKWLEEELNLSRRHHSRPPYLLWQQDGWHKNSGQLNFPLEIILVYPVLEECSPVTKAHNVSAGFAARG